MGKYDFIKTGNLLYWNDPDNGISSGGYKVISVPEEVYEDSIILIASDHSEAEVLASELSPIPPTRSHKEEFLKWREKQEADYTEIALAYILQAAVDNGDCHGYCYRD